MAVTLTQHKDDEARVISRLYKHFDWEKNECFPFVMVFPWESDLLVLSQSLYVTEIEVKVSLSDWRADLQKAKFNEPYQRGLFQRAIKRFYYAVPATIYSKYAAAPFALPDGAGVLVLDGWGKAPIQEVVAPKTSPLAKNLGNKEYCRLQRSLYFRFSRQVLKGGVRLGLQEA